MLKPNDEARICKAVRQAIITVLQADLEGDEQIMKEVWEECGSMDEQYAAQREIAAIITLIQGRAS